MTEPASGAAGLFLGLVALFVVLAEVVELADVPVGRPLGEGLRVGEVFVGRQQVGVAPERVAALNAPGLVDGRPQGARLAQTAGAQLETDERGVFRTGGPPIAWFTDPAGNVLSVIEES